MTSASLYVGNLPFSTSNESLLEHLAGMGVGGLNLCEISMKGNRSKGWAIVEFESPEFAVSAMGILDGSSVDGRALLVREDRGERKPAPGANAAAPVREPKDDTPTNTLYVGNLPWEVTSEGLADLFAGIEIVTCEVQKRLSGRSKGFGTVEFTSVDDAVAGLNMIAGQVVGERTLTVRFDKQAQVVVPCSKLFVGNLPWSVDDDTLLGMFTGYSVTSAFVKIVGGRSRGFGVVEFESLQEAERFLMEKPEFEFDGRTIFVRFDRHQE